MNITSYETMNTEMLNALKEKAHVDTLHLVLKGKWYDLIASGEKTEEYRETKPYWIKRILDGSSAKRPEHASVPRKISIQTKYERVCFHRGYTSQTITFKIKGVSVGMGNVAWGAPVNKAVIIIKLGNKDYEPRKGFRCEKYFEDR